MIAPDERFVVENDGVALRVERYGNGPIRVLFAHGWISSRRMWSLVFPQIDRTRFTAYAFDFRGCGESDRPEQGHDLDGYASDLRAVLAALGPMTVAAHSMGGKVAQYVATEPESGIDRLLLVAPGTAYPHAGSEKHRALALDAFGSRARIERFQRGAMSRPPAAETIEVLVDDALIAQREHWFGWYDNGRPADFHEQLRDIAVPTLVLAGERDPLVPPSVVRREVIAPIAGALFVQLRGVGHNLPVEAPDDVAEALARFIPA